MLARVEKVACWAMPGTHSGLIAALIVALALSSSSGCNKVRLVEVTGLVTFEGQPVSKKARVLFANEESGIYIVANVDAEGRFRVEMKEGFGLPPGTYMVAVLPPNLSNPPDIPKKYRDTKTSELVVELTREGKVFNIDMQPE